MKKSIMFFISVLLFSCEPSISDEGKKELNNLRNKYSCYQVQIGSVTVSDMKNKNEQRNYIGITIVDCDGKLDFDSLQFHGEETKKIAEKMYFECKNKENYDGIQIAYNKNKKGVLRKEYLFLFDKETQHLNLIDSLILD